MRDLRFTAIYLIFCVMILLSVGCSGNSPATPDPAPDSEASIITPDFGSVPDGRDLMLAYNVTIDFENQDISLDPIRTIAEHYSILPLLQNPWFCPGSNCLNISFVEFDPLNGYFMVKATLVNPSSLTAYDVRGIVYDNDQSNHRMLNADDYTRLWAPPGYNSIYPFRAYGKSNDSRAFKPLASYSELYEFQFDPLPPKWNFQYAVDCSFPDQCEEPYMIHGQTQIGDYYSNRGCSKLSVEVEHHAGIAHVDSVTLDASPLGGVVTDMEYDLDNDVWDAMVINQVSIYPGDYQLLITATSPGIELELYDYFDITVYPGTDDEKIRGTVYDASTSEGIPLALMTTSDGDTLYTKEADYCGYLATNDVPDGSRVLSLTRPGYHSAHVLTTVGGDDIILEEYLELNISTQPDMPEIVMDTPMIDIVNGIMTITGAMTNMDCYNNQVGVYIHQGQERLMDLDDLNGDFNQTIMLGYGVNEIVTRATNASGTVLSEKILVEYYPSWDFRITLTWDTDDSDMDIHVWEPDLSDHCYYPNMITANLELDWDELYGYGPENITPTQDEPTVGIYPIAVNYYSDNDYTGGDQPTTCYLTLRLNPGTPFEEIVTFDYLLTESIGSLGYPVQYDTVSWWRPADLIVLDNGLISWQEPDYSYILSQ